MKSYFNLLSLYNKYSISVPQETIYTRSHYAKCGCESIQWSEIEDRQNRITNPETRVQYPLVSEDLWTKHIGSKRIMTKKQNSGDGDECVKFAEKHGSALQDDALLDELIEKSRQIIIKQGFVYAGDETFQIAKIH